MRRYAMSSFGFVLATMIMYQRMVAREIGDMIAPSRQVRKRLSDAHYEDVKITHGGKVVFSANNPNYRPMRLYDDKGNPVSANWNGAPAVNVTSDT